MGKGHGILSEMSFSHFFKKKTLVGKGYGALLEMLSYCDFIAKRNKIRYKNHGTKMVTKKMRSTTHKLLAINQLGDQLTIRS